MVEVDVGRFIDVESSWDADAPRFDGALPKSRGCRVSVVEGP